MKINEIKPGYVEIQGWIENLRDKKSMQFIVVKDLSGKIQVTVIKEENPEIAEIFSHATLESTVRIKGQAVKNEYVKLGGIEILPTEVELTSIADALPIGPESSLDQRMDYRWIDLRNEKNSLIFQVSSLIELAMYEYSIKNNFINIHTPKISGQSTEGGAEVFEVKYYDQKAFLTQSPQLYKQMAMASGFEKVFEIGACYRAEKSFTARHATEFFAYDVEMSYINSHNDVMDFEEGLLIYVMQRVKETYGEKIKEVFGTEVIIPEKMPRIKFVEVMNILKKQYGVSIKDDLDTESERLICDYVKRKYNSEYVFVTEYPTATRAFYSMHCPEDDNYTRSYDLLFKDGEITSGAQREHRSDILSRQIQQKGINPLTMKDYIDFFRYGCPPHGGFAIGLGRFVAKLLNLPSLKDATFVFRGPKRLNP